MKTILLLGASGFVGSNILEYFSDKNEYRFIAIVRKIPENNTNPLSIDYKVADLTDAGKMENVIDDLTSNNTIDFVIHAASATLPNSIDPLKDINENIIPMIHLLRLLSSRGIDKIIYISSGGAIYGNVDSAMITEDLPKHPLSPYGIGKLFIETYIDFYARNYGMQVVILRPSNLYGHSFKNIGKQGFINTALFNVLHDKPIEIWGDGSVVRDYLFIEDFVSIFPLILNHFETGIYNVGSSKGHSVNDIVGVIQNTVKKDIKVVYKEIQKNAPQTIVLNCEKVVEKYKWHADTAIEKGIEKLWNEISNC